MADVVLVIDMTRGFFEKGYPLYCGAKPIDFTADLHEVEGKPIAKRGIHFLPHPIL